MKPILFSTPMVEAILDGRKTMTRRIITNTLSTAEFKGFYVDAQANDVARFLSITEGFDFYRKPRYVSGDILWVRETWARGCMGGYIYKAGHEYADRLEDLKQWKPSIHMPKDAVRIFLKVTETRAERLQSITKEDAVKEGFGADHSVLGNGKFDDVIESDITARDAFCELWQELNLKRGYGWGKNPWVWAYTFERYNGEVVS